MADADAPLSDLERAAKFNYESATEINVGMVSWDEAIITGTAQGWIDELRDIFAMLQKSPSQETIEALAIRLWNLDMDGPGIPKMYRGTRWTTLLHDAQQGAPYAVTYLKEYRDKATSIYHGLLNYWLGAPL